MDLRSIAHALGGEVQGGQVLCPGPGHSTADRSLSIKLDPKAPDGFLVHSFSNDDPIKCRDHVRQKCGLPTFNNGNGRTSRRTEAEIEAAVLFAIKAERGPSRVVCRYSYVDATGTLLYEIERLEPKSFRARRPDGKGGWIFSLKDFDRRVLYRLPDLLKYPDACAFLCEGEKDADRVAAMDHCATTVAFGTWTRECIDALSGRDVLILEDADTAGEKKAAKAAEALHGTAKTIRIVKLPGLTGEKHNKDISDWLDQDPQRARTLADVCFDAPVWEPIEQPTEQPTEPVTTKAEPASIPPFPYINMARWDEEPTPEQEWCVCNRIPRQQVTLFSGEGGGGKSTIYLHLSAAHVLGRDWLGTMPELGPALFIDAEDGEKVIHRRLAAIARHYQVTFTDLINGGLHLVSFAGADAVMATVSRSGKVETTTVYKQLLQAAGDIKPVSIGIASSANVFTGDENNRSQVQQLVGLLTRIAILANGSVVLISHPSLTGITNDSGLSGTTQWHNAVRARFYLKGIKPESAEQPDNDLREIVFKKNQYGPTGENIALKYQSGLFLQLPGISSLDAIARETKIDEMFLTLLKRLNERGENITSNRNGNMFAPTVFAKEPEARAAGFGKKDFEDAMRRLFTADKVHLEPYGPPSKGTKRLAPGGKA